MKIFLLFLLHCHLVYTGQEGVHTSRFVIEMQYRDTVYVIHTTNSDGLDLLMITDTSFRLISLEKKNNDKECLNVKWTGSGYHIRYLGITRKVRSDSLSVDRHVLPYWIQKRVKNGKLPSSMKLLVPEIGFVPVILEEEKDGDGTLKVTMSVSGILGKIYRKRFYFFYRDGILVKYMDSDGRSLVLQNRK